MSAYHILIIDDDPTQHAVLGEYLKLAGYDVTHTNDGLEGLDALYQGKFHLVLLDVDMPGKDGFKVLEAIRKKAAFRDVGVILLTALDRRNLKIKGLELGADDYVTKPFDRAELLARINAILRRADKTRRLEGIMEGDLADVGLSDLLQSLELGNKTATISIAGLDAEIFVKDGELLGARMGSFSDKNALLRIMLLEKGEFSIQFNEIPKERSGPAQNISAVIMNVACDVDEIKDIVKQLSIGQKKISVTDDVTEFPTLSRIRDRLPATVTEMISIMEDTPGNNIKTLIAASKKRKLKVKK